MFNGEIPELPNISVDNFPIGGGEGSTVFFLTHCHKDHTNGLTGYFTDHLRKMDYYIYCSPISLSILEKDGHDVTHIRDITEATTIRVPGDEADGNCLYEVTVTPIPAGHCPGSVMFLFETSAETVLHTGDFRLAEGGARGVAQLQNYCNGSKIIDRICFDATFFSRDYWAFPPRSESIRDIVEIIKRRDPGSHVLLRTSARYGYEAVAIALAREFNCKINVGDEMCDKLSCLPGVADKITGDASDTRIHLFARNAAGNAPPSAFTIDLQAKRFAGENNGNSVLETNDGYVLVCYATHSSCSEIIDFLKCLKPRLMSYNQLAINSSQQETESLSAHVRSMWI